MMGRLESISPREPENRWGLDMVGLFLKSHHNATDVLIAVDYRIYHCITKAIGKALSKHMIYFVVDQIMWRIRLPAWVVTK